MVTIARSSSLEGDGIRGGWEGGKGGRKVGIGSKWGQERKEERRNH